MGNRIKTITDPNSGATTPGYPSGNVITYGYDSDGRVNNIAKGSLNLLSSITYMPFGQVSGWTEGSTATYSRTIDQDGRITTITISGTPSVPGTTTLTYLEELARFSIATYEAAT